MVGIFRRSDAEHLAHVTNEEAAERPFDRAADLELIRRMIGENVLREREHAGLSQDELADRSGIPRETINRLEKGKQEARMLTLLPIARALGVPLMPLLDGLLDS